MLGREKFLEECNKWKEKYSDNILHQFKKIGLSCDFKNTTFTLDPKYSKKKELYDKLVYNITNCYF